MKRVITTTVINQSGVLNRVTGLLMKRQFNIESITVGHTEQPGISKMTFVVHVEDQRKLEQLLKQLQKQIDVLKVNDISDKAIVTRELALIKVLSPPAVRSEITSIIEPFRATVIDMSKNVITVQVTGDPEKVEAFIDLVRPYGIKEMTRTGATAFVRENQKTPSQQLSIL
ncbi:MULTISPECIES: acetolactate synthase small subunit [Jeotgalibacillus]|uniref:Acetolactate synthase small subunit n=3 Tax=Jeotgalibacillus TaxID=157226 RepID=A0A0C2W123_9BACL|nr:MULTISPECIES: acetolactate synthase small subunit [Jeotgalibacillus]KIL50326.1 acetolactate synthase [Jeotgalibacillus alimentarius]MBM7578355.1 acetolactate synthase-1/3 small subunit [Jeotgalibacillus terrae]MDZ5712882.1 acetolactate synthase small subunit [Jeotgalibacillus sp. HH7-29]